MLDMKTIVSSTEIKEAIAVQQALLEQEPIQKSTHRETAKSKSRKSNCHNKELGKRGENAASKFLYKRGYEIVERNWKCKFGEADIIARDGNTIVFVEVKTRSGLEHGFPSEAIDEKKRNRYERIAMTYLANYADIDVSVRFDVVAIVAIAPDRALIRHHINAFAGI